MDRFVLGMTTLVQYVPLDNTVICLAMIKRDGEIAQSLVSLSVKRAVWVRTRLDPLVTER